MPWAIETVGQAASGTLVDRRTGHDVNPYFSTAPHLQGCIPALAALYHILQ